MSVGQELQRAEAGNLQIANRNEEEMEIDLFALLLRLLDKWYILAVAALLGACIMAGYSFFIATPMYESTAKLYVVNSKDSAINLSDLQIGNYLAKDYREVFTNIHVQDEVSKRLGLNYTYAQLRNMVSVTNPSDTRILYITVKSADPEEAMNMANTFAAVAQEFVVSIMQAEQPTNFEEARISTRPISPNKTRNVMMGFVAGGVLAAAFIVLQFIMDDYIRTSEDIEQAAGVPLLGMISEQEFETAMRGKKKGKKANAA